MRHMIRFILEGEFHSRDSSTYSSKQNTIKARKKRQAALKNANTAEYEKAKASDRSAKRILFKKNYEKMIILIPCLQKSNRWLKNEKSKNLSQKRFEERKSGKYFTIITFHCHINVSIAEWFEGEIEKNRARSSAIFILFSSFYLSFFFPRKKRIRKKSFLLEIPKLAFHFNPYLDYIKTSCHSTQIIKISTDIIANIFYLPESTLVFRQRKN